MIKKLQDFALKFKKSDDNKANKVKYNIDSLDLYDLVPPQQEKDSDSESSDNDSCSGENDKLAKISGKNKGKTVNRSENSILTFLGKHRVVASEEIKVKDL